MTWNYRIIYHADAEPEPWYGLHEVYYEGGEVTNWTRDAVGFVANYDEGSIGVTRSLARALVDAESRPVLILKAGQVFVSPQITEKSATEATHQGSSVHQSSVSNPG